MENPYWPLAGVLLLSLLMPVSGAGQNMTEEAALLLDSAWNDAECRIAFETEYMGEVATLFPNVSSELRPLAGNMEKDRSALQAYAEAGDMMNYSAYVHTQFSPHLQQNIETVRRAMEKLTNESNFQKPEEPGQGGGGGPGEEPEDPGAEIREKLKALNGKYVAARQRHEQCVSKTDHTALVINYYDAALARYRQRAQNLTARGINASALEALVAKAEDDVVGPLTDEAASSGNASQRRMLLGKYCLYNECSNGTNFQLAVRYEAMRMHMVLAALAPAAEKAGYGTDIGAAMARINGAIEEIDSWGGAAASPEEQAQVWEDIRWAARKGHDVFVALKGKQAEQG